uniref:Uncharacterized protein n=1 Tax=Ditylenchus dipsaci TaxID=166011 RepID=A0A915DMD5_9BILA
MGFTRSGYMAVCGEFVHNSSTQQLLRFIVRWTMYWKWSYGVDHLFRWLHSTMHNRVHGLMFKEDVRHRVRYSLHNTVNRTYAILDDSPEKNIK